jgi:hypothetical protein
MLAAGAAITILYGIYRIYRKDKTRVKCVSMVKSASSAHERAAKAHNNTRIGTGIQGKIVRESANIQGHGHIEMAGILAN